VAAKSKRFQTVLGSANDTGTMTFIEVPAAVIAALGTRKRLPVNVKLNGYEYRTTVCVYGGEYFLPVRRAIRDAAKIRAGQHVRVEIAPDEKPRTVEVPADLAAALRKAGLLEAFDRFSYSHRREYVGAIAVAKRPETRAKRIAATVDAARAKKMLMRKA
jgi:hypothetical protein